MVIYKQALFKYIKAPSTWIILVLSLFISSFVAGYMAFDASSGNSQLYGYSVILSVGVMTSMVSIFSSIFAGFKASSMFRDEIENGTFLVMLSKPQTRTKIIFQKWLALQTAMLGFVVLNVLFYEIFVAIFDNYNTFNDVKGYGVTHLTPNLFSVGGYVFLVLFILSLIFSSISMALSTRLSSSSTIGISIAIGVVIPITAMVGMFTHSRPYEKPDDNISYLSQEFEANLFGQKDIAKDLPTDKQNLVTQTLDNLYKIINDPKQSFYHIGFKNGETDSFTKYWVTDLSYQLGAMGSISTEDMVTERYKNSLSGLKVSAQMTPMMKVTPIKNDPLNGLTIKQKEAYIFDKLAHTIAETIKAGNVLTGALQDSGLYDTEDSKDFRGKLYDMEFNPMDVILNDGHVRKASEDDWSTDIDQDFSFTKFTDKVKALINANQVSYPTPLPQGYKLPTYNPADSEKTIYDDLMRLVQNAPENIAYIKEEDYANGWNLLWIYLAIAIVLVPASLLLMRKKDFR